MAANWTKHEIKLILEDYFQMLRLEITGRPYKKSEFRRALLPKLNNRNEGSIEFKHQNISAVLLKYKMPYIIGYKPLPNYQTLLEESVLDFLVDEKDLDGLFTQFSTEATSTTSSKIEYSKLLVEPPQSIILEEPKAEYTGRLRKPNYLEIEQSNRKLGMQGEELVMEYEKWRLISAGKENLAESIEWISKDQGDGAGFDILSKNENGKDRFIEVKTTKLGELTPFYFSKNELTFSQKKSRDFFLYRVFKFHHGPNLFVKNGSFDEICSYEATSYMGRII
ncbi:MAG: DUF3883 domain-containing protein [Bacteroidia bacterium]